MKIRVGYTAYVEKDIEIDDKFAILEEPEGEDDWQERDRLCDEMLTAVRNEVGFIHIDSIMSLDEDGEEAECLFEM